MKFYALKSKEERLAEIERLSGVNLVTIAGGLELAGIEGRNIENMVGSAQIPLGVAGPLRVGRKKYLLPLATTEGALVASVNRGCKAISLSGGVKVEVEEIGATRGPVFRVTGIREGRKLSVWLKMNQDKLGKLVRQGERHLVLTAVTTAMVGKNVYARFRFKTDEAMGMNMVTIAAEKIANLVKQELGINCVAISGNYCVDKKPAWINGLEGRGKKVWAEIRLTKEVVRRVLKTTPEKIAAGVRDKQWLGSMMSGSMGFNGHFANVVAAIFLATGQDIAHVVESSLGVTVAEVSERESELYFAIYLPSLMLGTVGGGTQLPTQREALAILELGKGKKGEAIELAKITAGAVLAGELSLTAALASGDLGRAHQRLGRGKLKKND